MRVRVLGCHGAELGECGTSGFLINRSVLVDAGTVCSALTIAEQRKIRYILVSHIHMDHIKSLPLLSENLIENGVTQSIVIVSLKKVIDELKRHVFNDRLWPDFTKIPTPTHPLFQLEAIDEGKALELDDLQVRAFAVNHTVPCAGFLIRDRRGALLYSGDTYRTDRLWKAAASIPDLKAAMIETSFPDALEGLAAQSKHLTPSLLQREFAKVARPDLPVYVYHMKPRYLAAIRRELEKLPITNLTILEDGATFQV